MSRYIAVLLRHGDYHQLANIPGAHQPFALNEEGLMQAKKAIELLKEMSETNGWVFHPVVDSSNLQRSWQTANIIAQGITAIDKVESFDELAERGLGCAANLTIKQIEKVLDEDPRFETPPKNWKSDSYYCLPLQGAESLIDAGKRVADHLSKRMSEIIQSSLSEDDKDIMKVFVGHGAAFRHAVFHLGALKYKQLAKLSMFHAQPVAFEIHADKTWCHVAGEWKIRSNEDNRPD